MSNMNRKRITLTFEIDADNGDWQSPEYLAKDFLGELSCACNMTYEDTFRIKVEDTVPPVEQPMSAVEYLKERNRMESWSAENCNQASLDCDDECCKCPYGRVPNCKDEANRPLEAIAIVEAWAKEYPERSIE